jgi:hypothetical protein
MINSSSYCISNADDITEVKEGLSDSTYLYRAIVFFVISVKLDLIQEVTSIYQILFDTYPRIVGWLFILSNIKRIAFRMFNVPKDHLYRDVIYEIKDESISTSLTHSLADNSIESHHVAHCSKSDSYYCQPISDLLHKRSSQVESFYSSSINTYRDRGINDSSSESLDDNHRSKSRRKNIDTINSKRYNKSNSIADQSWGHFVDCPTTDEDDYYNSILLVEMEELRRSQSGDYGQFVDVASDDEEDIFSNKNQIHRTKKTLVH